MAFRIIRQRKEARKAAKIEEIFQEKTKKNINTMILALLVQERDKYQTGKISVDQLGDIYRIYQVNMEVTYDIVQVLFDKCLVVNDDDIPPVANSNQS